jgi:LPXTG-motif cell wall-anchored protein
MWVELHNQNSCIRHQLRWLFRVQKIIVAQAVRKGELHHMKMLKKIPVLTIAMTVLIALMMSAPTRVNSATAPVDLATASTFGILANTTITNAGTSSVSGSAGGDIGLYAGSSITGLSNLTISGTVHISDATALLAKADLSKAYDNAAGRTPFTTIATELGGKTLAPGVYTSKSGTFGLTGTLTLDAKNDANAVFIFQMTKTLITASASRIIMKNGARACNVSWQVGSSATLGTNSYFIGHIMASTSITARTGARLYGTLHAKTGAVTLQSNKIMNIVCSSSPTEEGGMLPRTGSDLYGILMLGAFLVLVGVVGLRFRKRYE